MQTSLFAAQLTPQVVYNQALHHHPTTKAECIPVAAGVLIQLIQGIFSDT